jgi:outer membrane protein OmpA-like peptidoglycan-associated protein
VTFPASIQTITASAFRGSTSLTSISFAGNLAPANVHEDAFAGIGSLATANIAYEARSSFGLNGSTWKGLVVSYAEPEPTPDPSSDYTPAPAPVVPDPVTTKSTSFVFDSVVLSKSNKKVIRVLFREFGVLGIYKVKTGVLFIPLTTKAQDKALALKKARAIKRYLIGLGVKKKNITVSSKVYKAGVAVRTSVSGSKKAIS